MKAEDWRLGRSHRLRGRRVWPPTLRAPGAGCRVRFRYAPFPCQNRGKKTGIQGIRCISPSMDFDDKGHRGVPFSAEESAGFKPTTHGAIVYRDTTISRHRLTCSRPCGNTNHMPATTLTYAVLTSVPCSLPHHWPLCWGPRPLLPHTSILV